MSNTQTAPVDHMENNYCWVTGELIPVGAPCRFTFEWDAWVSEEGQKRVWECKSDDPQWEEIRLIRDEWYAEDAFDRHPEASTNGDVDQVWLD